MKASCLLFMSLALLTSGMAACAKKLPVAVTPVEGDARPAASMERPAPSLYERLGGKDGMSGVLESFVGNLRADKRVNKLFVKTTGPKLEHFTQMLADQLCELSGGGCHYAGKSMQDAHAGMMINDVQFDAIIQDLSLALEERQVSKDNEKELLDKLATLRDDIVFAPASGSTPP